MKTKTLAVAIALTVAPTLTFAMGCNYGSHEKQAMSCAAGTQFDEKTGTCVKLNA
jgi:hypothetical protein